MATDPRFDVNYGQRPFAFKPPEGTVPMSNSIVGDHRPLKVRCAICDRPVDRLEWHADLIESKVTMTAYCHGDKEAVVIDAPRTLDAVRQIQAQEGVAFAPKPITPALAHINPTTGKS